MIAPCCGCHSHTKQTSLSKSKQLYFCTCVVQSPPHSIASAEGSTVLCRVMFDLEWILRAQVGQANKTASRLVSAIKNLSWHGDQQGRNCFAGFLVINFTRVGIRCDQLRLAHRICTARAQRRAPTARHPASSPVKLFAKRNSCMLFTPVLSFILTAAALDRCLCGST